MPTFHNWESRPAVLAGDGSMAFAVLATGEDWVAVDESDVRSTAPLIPEDGWREAFARFIRPAAPVESLFQPESTPDAADTADA